MTCSIEPPAAPMASVLRISRLVTEFSVIVCLPEALSLVLAWLQIAFLRFIEQVLGRAPGQRHDRKGWILVGVGDERRAIHDENILYIMRLAEAIQHGTFRVGAHPRRANLVDDLSTCGNAEGTIAADGSLGFVDATRGFDDGAKSFLHVLGLANFVLAPLEMKAQNGDAPFIDNVRVDLAVGVWIRNHFAPPGHANARAIGLARAFLQRGAVTFLFVQEVIKLADAGHIAAAAKLDVIAAREIILAVEFPPGNVHVHAADTVMIVRGHFFELRDDAPAIAANGIGEVFADSAGGIGEAVGELRRFGVEQQARGFAGAGCENDGASIYAFLSARGFVDVRNAFSFAVLAEN